MRSKRSLLQIGAAVATLILVATALSAPVSAPASGFKLHPNGFGEHSYAAWRAHEGRPDSRGSDEQALYFQKMTATAAFAAGVAVIKGFEGVPTDAVVPLAFDRRMDGHCGAGAPRFNVRVEVSPGVRQTVFIGCAAMAPSAPFPDTQGRLWERRTYSGPLPPGTIVSIAIVFDEGNDVGPGYVYLDNIQVGSHVWTGAGDNGSSEPNSQSVEELLGEPLSVLFP